MRTCFWARVVSILAITGSLAWGEAPEETAAQERLEARITPPDAKPTSDQLWAEAIFLSFPTSESPVETVRSRLTAALLRAERKAPLYRTLSTLDSSPLRLRELFDGDFAASDRTLAAAIAAGTTENAPLLRNAPPAVVEQTLRQILARSLRRTHGPQQLVERAVDINEIMRHGMGFSRECLAAALAEEPDYAPAWFDLAVKASPEELDRATQNFLRADPENALPYLLRAGWFSDQEDFDEAAGLIEIAATKRHCRVYEAEFPADFELRYPDTPLFRELDLVGQRLTPAALRNMSHLADADWNWSDPVTRSLGTLAYRLRKRAEILIADGKPQQGLRHLAASQSICACLICSVPPRVHFLTTGLVHQGDTIRARRLYLESEGRCAEVDQLAEIRYAHNEFLDSLRDESSSRVQKEFENRKAVFEGKIDLVELESSGISTLVRASGFSLPWAAVKP